MNYAAIIAALFALGAKIAESTQTSNDEIEAELKKKVDADTALAAAFEWYEKALKNAGSL